MEKKYNYTYKVTNLINNKFYYGCHSTNDLLDNYMGSGILLHKAFNKHGKENFEIDWLENFDTKEEMFQAEKEIITKELIDDPNCYNLTYGGFGNNGGVSNKIKVKISKTLTGRTKRSHTNVLKVSIMKSEGLYITPFGTFYSARDAAKHLGCSKTGIMRSCRYKNQKIFTRVSFSQYKGIFTLFEGKIGMTFNEIGFSFKLFTNKQQKLDLFNKLSQEEQYAN